MDVIVLEPIILGAPWLLADSPNIEQELMFNHMDFYQRHAEEIAQFSRVTEVSELVADSEWMPVMQALPEIVIKELFCQLIGESPTKDWGGELSDIFATSLRLDGKRATASFLLKGPANFKPMTPKHLGKNADQIYRLSLESSEILVLQHSHAVTPSVRGQLHAFAVQPSNPRKYVIIDGRETYRILKAYSLIDEALRMASTVAKRPRTRSKERTDVKPLKVSKKS